MAKANVSRRSVLGAIGAGVVMVPLASEAARADTGAHAAGSPASAPKEPGDPRALVAPLAPGSRFARWTIDAIHPLSLGALGVRVRGDAGEAFELEIFARDPSSFAARPPAVTERFAIHVVNGGDGWHPTIEEQGLAAMTLASVVAKNEHTVDVAGFLTHAERCARHASTSTEKPSREPRG
jgi:hypothetical protein